MHHPACVVVFANLEALQTPYYWDFLAASSHRHDQLLTQFLAPLSSGEWDKTAENSKLLIMDWSFWLPVSIQEPSRIPPRVASLEQKMLLVLLSLRNLQGFRSSVLEVGRKVQAETSTHVSYHFQLPSSSPSCKT